MNRLSLAFTLFWGAVLLAIVGSMFVDVIFTEPRIWP